MYSPYKMIRDLTKDLHHRRQNTLPRNHRHGFLSLKHILDKYYNTQCEQSSQEKLKRENDSTE